VLGHIVTERGKGIGVCLVLMVDSDVIRIEEELRRTAVTAVVILTNQRGARATTLGTFQCFDVLGHTRYELCKEQ